jgi:hypothetical protein
VNGRCRACGQQIEWALTTNAKRIPLDVTTSDRGNIKLTDGVAVVVPPGIGDRVSHFATCTAAASFRRK